MFKTEYLSNLSFRVRVLCLHWNSIDITCKPHLNIQNPYKIWVQFLMHLCEYRMTWSIKPLNTKL